MTAICAWQAPAAVPSATPALVPFQAKMTIRRDEEFAEMFEQSWRALDENFYDIEFHGANWNAVREKYRPLVKHVALREDFYALINLMMGELNASHLGIRACRYLPRRSPPTWACSSTTATPALA